MSSLRQMASHVSSGDAARIIGVSRQAIALMVKRGVLTPSFETRAGRMFDVEHVREVAAARGGENAKWDSTH